MMPLSCVIQTSFELKNQCQHTAFHHSVDGVTTDCPHEKCFSYLLLLNYYCITPLRIKQSAVNYDAWNSNWAGYFTKTYYGKLKVHLFNDTRISLQTLKVCSFTHLQNTNKYWRRTRRSTELLWAGSRGDQLSPRRPASEPNSRTTLWHRSRQRITSSVHVVGVGRPRLLDLVQVLCDEIVKTRLHSSHHRAVTWL